jgi:hypothetical protein
MNDNKKLVIELDELDSTPRVFIDGKEIEGKDKVTFVWNEFNENRRGFTKFNVEYHDILSDVEEVFRTVYDGFLGTDKVVSHLKMVDTTETEENNGYKKETKIKSTELIEESGNASRIIEE